MNKKIWTLLVAVLLIVTMSVCLFACSDNQETTAKQGSTFSTKEAKSAQTVTKAIQVNQNASFEVLASETMSETAVASAISLVDQQGATVSFRAIDIGSSKFRITPVNTLTAGGWYTLTSADARLTFAEYDNATKLSIYVLEGTGEAVFSDNVTYLTGGSSYISNFAESGALKTFDFDALAAKQTLSMGQIVLVEDVDSGDYTAYQVLGVEETATAGIYRIAYASPNYEEVYESLSIQEQAILGENEDTVVFDEEAIKETISAQLSLVGFDLGAAHFDINPALDMDNKQVKIEVNVTIPDLIADKDGVNSLDLTLTFVIETKITVDTDISIGALLAAKENGIQLDATFDNTLTFGVTIEDGAAYADTSALDAVLEKIANLVKGEEEDDITIDVFNWIIPIGNGIAAINFDVNVDMNFRFSGEIGVTSTSTAVVATSIFFNPSTEEKDFAITDSSFNFESVEIAADGNAAAYIGLDAAIKFDLLGGVISVGVGAEVGNFNKVYGTIASTNLLADPDAYYGIYFEGGIYYDAKFLYNVAKITSGSISFFGGRQEKVLYDAGSPYVVTALQDVTLKVSVIPQDIEIPCTYKNIVDGTVVNSWTNIIDATKIKLKADNAYVVIEDGKISLTEEGYNTIADGYYVDVVADGIDAKIYINKLAAIDTTVGTLTTVNVGNVDMVTASYLDGTSVVVAYESGYTDATFTPEKAGVIVVYVNGEVYKIVNVK